jgi:putative hydrolase of the HAD superfamily
VAAALERQGVAATARLLEHAEPRARLELDTPHKVATSDDASRARLYFDLVLHHAGLKAEPGALTAAWEEVRAYHAQHNLWELVPQETIPGLERLRRLGLKLVVVSNANGTLRAHFARLGLATHFDVLIDSQEEGVEKPDPRLFAIALERSGARRETTVHVGDIYHVDVVGARAAGLRPVLFDPAGLYADRECPRVVSLAQLADRLEAGAL